jgi:hypothetical protein
MISLEMIKVESPQDVVEQGKEHGGDGDDRKMQVLNMKLMEMDGVGSKSPKANVYAYGVWFHQLPGVVEKFLVGFRIGCLTINKGPLKLIWLSSVTTQELILHMCET